MKEIVLRLFAFITDIVAIMLGKFSINPPIVRTARAALEQWKIFVAENQGNRKDNGKSILFFATRNEQWAAWAVLSSCKVYLKGYTPVIMYSKQEFDDELLKNRREDMGKIWKAARWFTFIKFINIDDFVDTNAKVDSFIRDFADDYAHTIVAYDLRLEEHEEDYFTAEYKKGYDAARAMILKLTPAIEKIVLEVKPFRIVTPNGLIGRTTCVLAVHKKLGVDTLFVEGWARRTGHMIWNLNSPAMEYNIMGWFDAIGGIDGVPEEKMKEMVAFQNNAASSDPWFEDFIPVQRSAIDSEIYPELKAFLEKKGKLFMAGLNVIGDSATLRRGSIFQNQKEWLRALTQFMKEHTEFRLLIRAHPDEYILGDKCKIKLGDFLAELTKGCENIFIVPAWRDVNTYYLIEQCDVALAWVSNFGVDSLLRGKPVLVAGKAVYKGLNIGYTANSKEEYFNKIVELVNMQFAPVTEELKKAKAYQYIVFKEMSLKVLRTTKTTYRAHNFRMLHDAPDSDPDKFYRMLVGELNQFAR